MESKKTNIYLIGPMGAGKTSVGKQLAKLTGKIYFDSDHEVEKRAGVGISWIFEVESEEGFRKRETQVIKSLSQMSNIIVSTGGGSIIREENQHYLQRTGLIVYLSVSLETQLDRVARRPEQRPLIAADDAKASLLKINAFRQPIYERLANLKFDTNSLDPRQIAKNIIQKL